MALITCPECGGQVSDKAPACIHCGYPFSTAPIKQPQAEKPKFYYIEAIRDNSWGTKFKQSRRTMEVFPAAAKEYPFREYPHLIGTGLTKENAEWFKKEFLKFYVTVDVRFDENCTEPNERANKYAEDGRNDILHCPRCNSIAVTVGQRGFSITTGFIGSSKTMNRCAKCGYKWYPGKE